MTNPTSAGVWTLQFMLELSSWRHEMLILTAMRKQFQQTKAEKIAFRQNQTISDQLNSMPATGQTSQQASGSEFAVEDAIPAALNDGMVTVCPGHNGEPFWTEWKGK